MTAGFIEAARKGKGGPRIYVRINPVDTALWRDDLASVIGAAPHGIFQPKCRSGADVQLLAAALGDGEREWPPSARPASWPSSRKCRFRCSNLASYVGCSDTRLGHDLGRGRPVGGHGQPRQQGRQRRLQLALPARPRPVPLHGDGGPGAAVRHGIRGLQDAAGLEAECRGRRDGFTGKIAIHPDQCAVINRVLTPSEQEIARARKIIAAFEDNPGVGVVGLDGEMLDQPHLVRSRRIIERARLAGAAAG